MAHITLSKSIIPSQFKISYCYLTSRGSNIPFLVTMICLGCSSTGSDRISAATSSAVFHLANYNKNQFRATLITGDKRLKK